jgi:hypothetical protein
MMEKTKEDIKRMLRKQWEQACNGYLVELLRMWELDSYYGFWVGKEVGGVYDYGYGMFTISMDDIIYCVLEDITREQYEEWQQYICDASEFNFNIPNLRSWMRGCPRIPKETFNTLRKMKQDFIDAVEEEKNRIKK